MSITLELLPLARFEHGRTYRDEGENPVVDAGVDRSPTDQADRWRNRLADRLQFLLRDIDDLLDIILADHTTALHRGTSRI